MIREFRGDDAAAVAALIRESEPLLPVTPAGVVHWLAAEPARARPAAWVAEEDGEVVGWARARRLWQTSAEGVGELWAVVRPAARRRGHGRSLHEAAVAHLRAAEARVLQSWSSADAGGRFLAARGYRPTRTERISVLDPVVAAAAAEAPEGFAAVPLRRVLDRPRELHALDAAATADVPETFVYDDVRYDEWVRETLEDPQLSLDGSFVVLQGERPVAYAFLAADVEAGLAANEMTGTLAEFRGRGLARLAKLATIRWADETGIRTIITTNDEENVPMLRLNESLGYRPVGVETQYLREER